MLTALLYTAVRLSDKRAITVRHTCAVALDLKTYRCAVHIFSCLLFRLCDGRFYCHIKLDAAGESVCLAVAGRLRMLDEGVDRENSNYLLG
jgi:hypothetical protein